MTVLSGPKTGNVVSDLCQSCPIHLRVGCNAILPKMHGQGHPCRYLLVGEAPGWQEERDRVPFIGDSGKLLREALHDAEIPINDCVFSNSTWCAPKESAYAKIGKPTPQEAYHCITHTYEIVSCYKPEMIIPIGAVALRVLTGETSSTKMHGRVLSILDPPLAAQYKDFRMWVRAHWDTLKDSQYAELWETEFSWEVDPLAAENQIFLARTEHDYQASWEGVPVMPIVHPSYALRTGGRNGRWGETILHDLQSAKVQLDGNDFKDLANYRWINDIDEWSDYVDDTISRYEAGEFEVVACDIETAMDCPNSADSVNLTIYDPRIRILTMQFCYKKHEAVSVMVNHKDSKFNDITTFRVWRYHLDRLLKVIPLVGQNFTFDAGHIRNRLGLHNLNVHADTMLMEHWLSMGKGLSYALDHIGARHVGTGKHKTEAQSLETQGIHFENMPSEVALFYAAGDADVTLQPYYVIKEKLQAEGRWESYRDFYYGEHECWQLINEMQHAGMPVCKDTLDWLAKVYPENMKRVILELHDNSFVLAWMEKKRLESNKESLEYNSTIQGTRRKERLIPDPIQWRDDRDNWFNPDSWVQIQDMILNVIKIPYQYMEDLKMKEICRGCQKNKSKCKCPAYESMNVPTTDKDNRKILLDYCDVWKDSTEDRLTAMYESPTDRAAEIKDYEQRLFIWSYIIEYLTLVGQYKSMSKAYGTYVAGIYNLIIDQPEDGSLEPANSRCYHLYMEFADFPNGWAIHPGYKQHGTVTGRLASEDPNGQNFPKYNMDPTGNVRSPYISRWRGEGGIIVQPDYSQIEVRVMVSLAEDFNLAKAINEGRDIHTYVTSIVYHIPEEEVTEKLRTPTKQITFGILYGQGVTTIAKDLRIPVDEAKALQADFFGQMPAVKGFVDSQHRSVKKRGYVETLMGRRRYMEDIWSKENKYASKARREAVNTPIQSLASDLCWTAMGRAWKSLKELRVPSHPYCIIHDSQTFDVGPGYFMDVMELMYYQMVWRPYELWDWIICKPEAEFDIGAGWGYLVSCGIKFNDNGSMSNQLTLSGSQEDIDRVHKEINNGGQDTEVEVDGPHPNPKEAEKGKKQRILLVDRQNPLVRIEGRDLKILREL